MIIDRQIEITPAFLPEAVWDSAIQHFLDTQLTVGKHIKGGEGVTIYVLDDDSKGYGHAYTLRHMIGDRISNATLVSIGVFGDKPTMLSDMLLAIRDIIERHQASGERFGIINCSWVIPKDPEVEAAFKIAMDAGLLVIAAAGNGGHDTAGLTPASMAGAITIGSYTPHTGTKLETSNYGDAIDFWMPTLYNFGTSASTAIMSGLVANFIADMVAENANQLTLPELRDVILAQNTHRHAFPVFPNLVHDQSPFIVGVAGILGAYHEGDTISVRLLPSRVENFTVSPLPNGIELRDGILVGTIGAIDKTEIVGFLVRVGEMSAYYEIVLVAADQSLEDLSAVMGEEIILLPLADRMIHYTLSGGAPEKF